jgi:hypothetical protein
MLTQCLGRRGQWLSDTCIVLLEAAERALDRIRPGQGPVSLALARSYLTDAILETEGREP